MKILQQMLIMMKVLRNQTHRRVRKRGNNMENVVVNMRVYVNTLIDKLIAIKDSNRNTLTRNEIDTINAACNLLEHNLDNIKET